MKKTRTGFTLIELLAVIVILGIILVIAGSNFMNIRKNANIEEAKKLEKTLTDLGPNIYSHEYISGIKDDASYCDYIGGNFNGYYCYKNNYPQDITGKFQKYFYYNYNNSNEIKISLEKLANAGYIKSQTISNPAGGDACKGYLEVKKTDDGPEFKGYICCPNLYETGNNSVPTTCSDITSDITLSE